MADSIFSSAPSISEVQGIVGDINAKNNAWSAAQAQKQMDFQKMMSDTAHQREVADLKAAGLNPILSVQHSGAAVTQGASGNTDESGANAIVNFLGTITNSLLQLELQRNSAEIQEALTDRAGAISQLVAAISGDATKAAASTSAWASMQNAQLNAELQKYLQQENISQEQWRYGQEFNQWRVRNMTEFQQKKELLNQEKGWDAILKTLFPGNAFESVASAGLSADGLAGEGEEAVRSAIKKIRGKSSPTSAKSLRNFR